MSNSPFKQLNRAMAAQGMLDQNTEDKLMNKINEIGELNDEKKKEVGNYNVEMQKILNNAGELSANEYANIYDTLNREMKSRYEVGTSKEQALLQREQTMMAESANELSRIKTRVAEAWDDSELSANWKNTPKGKAVLELLSTEDAVLEKRKCPEGEKCGDEGEMGVMMPDFNVINATNDQMRFLDNEINELDQLYEGGQIYDDGKAMNDLLSNRQELQNVLDAGPLKWTSMQELDGMVKEVDNVAKGALVKRAAADKKIGKSNNPEDEIPFNRADAKDFIDGSIIGKGDKDSLVYDEMIPGRVFYNDLVNWIKGSETGGRTYKDLGITDLQLEDADINADGKIDDNEAKNLANALINNRETDSNGKLMIDNYLSTYYVNFLENQHKLGVDSNKKKKVDPGASDTSDMRYGPPVEYKDLDTKGKRIWNKLRDENNASKYIPGSLGRKL